MFSFSRTTTTTTAAKTAATATVSTTPSNVATSETVTATVATVETVTATATLTPVANSLKMPQTGDCLVTLPPPTTNITYNFEQNQHQEQQPQQHFTVAAATNELTNDPYETYTDNFDLSLLPQDYNSNTVINTINRNNTTITLNQTNLIDTIPTTVYNFDQQQLSQDKTNTLAVPDIKIEQTWSSCPSLNTIKQEQSYQSYFPVNTQPNQLVPPPPAYSAHIYPSPQSSPAQSEYNFPSAQFNSLSTSTNTCYESLSSSRNSLYNAVSSPCPSIDVHAIKQEQLHILPPSPPESSCDTPTPQSSHSSCSSGFDFKSEPFDSDVETFNDLNKNHNNAATIPNETCTDHQVLREYLEDTSFQKRNNLKPLALESFIGGLEEVRDNFEPVISLALEHAKREADATCAKLQISQDPTAWSANQVHAWLRSTLQQFELPIVEDIEHKFNENGAELLQLTEEEFVKRIPACGSTLHAQLEIWKVAYSPEYCKNNMWTNNVAHVHNNSMDEDSEEENGFLMPNTTNVAETNTGNNINSIQTLQQTANGHFVNNDEMLNVNTNGINNNNNSNNNNNNNSNNEGNNLMTPVKRTGTRNGGSHIHLWQFLKELLAAPHINGTAIRWIDRSKGIFKIEDSVRVAKLWGKRKNRPAMNYDKLSRSIRQYYKKGIMKKTERSQRLVYQFCQPYHV